MPAPIPKPMPKPPMRPSYPMHPMQPYPCIPCDEKLIQRLYKHMKMCHRHEMEIIKMMKRYCMKKSRRGCESSSRYRWDSSPYSESPWRRRNPSRPYESPESPRYNNPYESSSFRN